MSKYSSQELCLALRGTPEQLRRMVKSGQLSDLLQEQKALLPREAARLGRTELLRVLCQESPETIRKMIFECLDAIQGHGGIAFSSGNSIPDYVPAEGYLAMNEAVRDWRGDKRI